MNEIEKNYLAHHGILGQRWHKRNGPPYPLDAGDHSKQEKEAGYKKSLNGGRNEQLYDRKTRKRAAKEAARDLNRNDQEMAENRYKFNQAKKKFDKYEKKMFKAKEGSKKREKYASKSLDAWLDSEEAREAIDKGQDRAREILGYLEENGYNVKMKDTMRTVNRGENFVKSILLSGTAGAIGNIVAGPAGIAVAATVMSSDRVKGTKFKVKDKSKKDLAKVKEENYKKNMDRIQEKYDLAHEKEKEYLKKHPGAKEGEDYDFVEKFYTKADEEIEKKYKR